MKEKEGPLFTDEMPLGALLGMLTRQYAGAFSLVIEPTGADRYISLLLLLNQYGVSAVNQQCLANRLRIDKASMVRMTKHLCEQGFLKRIVNPDNRREYLLTLTSAGKRLIPEVQQCISTLNRDVFKGLNASEKKQLFKMMEKISVNMSELPGNPVELNLKPVKKN